MAWKPKQKKLTAEEAIALARQELAPLWFNSPPLLAGVRSGTRATAHPLDTTFAAHNWLMLFLDPTTFCGESAIEYFKEWFRRYGMHDLKFMICLGFRYRDIFTRQTIEEHLLHPNELTFPVFIDSDGSLLSAFGADRELPKVLFFQKGKTLFEFSGPDWTQSGELKLQEFLRKADPGLPLLPAMKSQKTRLDHGGVEFANSTDQPGRNNIQFVDALPEDPAQGRIYICGKWTREPQRILTSDPSACITFRAPSPRIAVIARSIQKTIETGTISVQINGMPVFEDFLGRQLVRDDEGATVVRVASRWLYEIATDLPDTDRLMTFRFPEAHQIPVALYGLRFGAQAEAVSPF